MIRRKKLQKDMTVEELIEDGCKTMREILAEAKERKDIDDSKLTQEAFVRRRISLGAKQIVRGEMAYYSRTDIEKMYEPYRK